MEESTSTTPTDISATVSSSCSGTSCSNVVRSVKLYLTQSNTINLDYSYAVVGDLEGIADGCFVNVEYNY